MMKKFFIGILVAHILTVGCTRYDNPEPYFEEYEQDQEDTGLKRKVLVISVDGLVGNEIKKDVPATIAALMENSKYSFDGLSDENTSDPASWATLVMGVSASRHHVVTESYLPSPGDDDWHAEIPFNPTVFYMLGQLNKKLSTVAITQNNELSNILLMDAKQAFVESNDEAVKTRLIAKLKDENPDLIVAQFTSALEAGKASSFSFDSPQYKEAVGKIDGYIGEIKQAMEAREDYDKEQWLLVVTSAHGGKDDSYGGSSFPERNIFTLYHNRYIKGQELHAESIDAPRFFGYDVTNANPTNAMRARNTTAPATEKQYNVAETGEFTVEAKVKVNKNASGNYSYSWPPFLSKTNARSGNTAGWSFFRSGDNVSFFVADGGAKIEIGGGPVGVDEIWTHITGTFKVVNGTPTAKFYVNGVLASTGTATLNVNNILSTSPLTFGFQQEVFSSAYIDFYMSDVHIWNIALSDQEVLENAERIGVPEDHPKITHLVGYWPLNDGGNLFKNKVDGMPDIPVWGPLQYRLFGNNLPYVNPRESILFKSHDVVQQALYWLELDPKDDWELEGEAFLERFELEFVK